MMESPDLVSQLTNLVIRPHRQIYGIDRLGKLSVYEGAKKILTRSKITKQYLHVNRKDVTLNNTRKIQLSVFQPQYTNTSKSNLEHNINNQHQKQRKNKIVVFLHSNSGSRLQGLEYIKFILEEEIIAVLFDYCGSGISEGEYVTMGINESKDLGEVYKYLKQQYNISKISLWGRSMGAVTAIIYASKHPEQISSVVLDSPFSSFRELVKDLIRNKTGLPDFLFSPIISKIGQCIQQKTNENLFEIDLRKNIHKMKPVKCLFLTSKNDQLVPALHTQQLYDLHLGIKDIVYLDGHHNEPRSIQLKERCCSFLAQPMSELPFTKSSLRQFKPDHFRLAKNYHPMEQNNITPKNQPITPKNHTVASQKISKIAISKIDKNNYHAFTSASKIMLVNTQKSKEFQRENQQKNHRIFRLSGKETHQSLTKVKISHQDERKQQKLTGFYRQDNIQQKPVSSKISLSIFKKSTIINSESSNTDNAFHLRNKYQVQHYPSPKVDHNHQFIHSAKTGSKDEFENEKKIYVPIKQHINLCGELPNDSEGEPLSRNYAAKFKNKMKEDLQRN